MFDAALIPATPTSRDGASGIIRSLRKHHPGVAVYVLATAGTTIPEDPSTVIEVAELVAGEPLAVTTTLDPDNQLAFGMPFALERVLADHQAVVCLSPGCLVAGPLDELGEALAHHAIVLVSPTIPTELHSVTPNLVALARRRELISSRLLGVGRGAGAHLEFWKDTMRQSFFDVFQRLPGEFVHGVLAELAAAPDATVVGTATLAAWTDYAAIASGRASGPEAAVLAADQLWELGRKERRAEQALDVDWQFMADKVHDSRPLEALMNLIREAIDAAPIAAPEETPFASFAREVRRAADPTGARWGPADHDRFREWLFEPNTNGLTRLAHLYWWSRPDLRERFADPKLDPAELRAWNDRSARAEFGMDLFDPGGRPVRPVPGAGEDAGDDPAARWSALNALKWRLTVVKGLTPGYGTFQRRRARRLEERAVPPLAPPRRVVVERDPPLYGRSPRSLNLIGCFRAESGLGQAARASLNALRLLGRDFSYIDTSEEYPSRNAVAPGLEAHTFGAFGDVNLLHSNADELLTLAHRVYRNRVMGRFNAAMWFWESARLPERSMPAFDVVDELWVASEYLADVFGQHGEVPVKVIGLAAELPESREADRTAFGIPADDFVFLFVYDALSSHGRKNPELALDAFIRAFAPRFEGVRFVLKVSNLNKFPASQTKLRGLADRYPAITLIDEYYPRERVLDLMAAADVSVSLHAAEGFGLTLLESMALGTPVVCTGYSGNMDFTTPHNSWLVDYTMMATETQTGPYPPGSVWAAPNRDSAADIMRHVAAHPSEVAGKAARAVNDAAEAASLERYAARLDAELRRVL